MLGVNVGKNTDIRKDIINTLIANTNFWGKFHYNEVDRIKILNAFVIPSIIHMLRHVPYNKITEFKLNKITTDFVW